MRANWNGIQMRHIQRAISTDSAQLFNLARDFTTSFRPEFGAFEVAFARLMTQDDALLLVTEESGQLLGYLLDFDHYALFANGRVSWVEEVMVMEDRRRQRIGGNLNAGVRAVGEITGVETGSAWHPPSCPVLPRIRIRRIGNIFPQAPLKACQLNATLEPVLKPTCHHSSSLGRCLPLSQHVSFAIQTR